MKGKLSREGTELRLPVYIKHFCVCVRHILFFPQGQTFPTNSRRDKQIVCPRGTNIFNTWRRDKHFYLHGGQTFSSGGGSGNDDFDCDDEEDLSKANILARILTVPEGPEIVISWHCMHCAKTHDIGRGSFRD